MQTFLLILMMMMFVHSFSSIFPALYFHFKHIFDPFGKTQRSSEKTAATTNKKWKCLFKIDENKVRKTRKKIEAGERERMKKSLLLISQATGDWIHDEYHIRTIKLIQAKTFNSNYTIFKRMLSKKTKN